MSSIPPIDTAAPKAVWAIDFQFDSTVDGKAIKIASMIEEHTRESLLHMVARSITAEHLVTELETVFAAAGAGPHSGPASPLTCPCEQHVCPRGHVIVCGART